jgi:hypothetical protein
VHLVGFLFIVVNVNHYIYLLYLLYIFTLYLLYIFTLYLLKRDYVFRSVQSIIRSLIQNFRNKADDSATVTHNIDPVCVSVFIVMYNYMQVYENCRRLVVLWPVVVKC